VTTIGRSIATPIAAALVELAALASPVAEAPVSEPAWIVTVPQVGGDEPAGQVAVTVPPLTVVAVVSSKAVTPKAADSAGSDRPLEASVLRAELSAVAIPEGSGPFVPVAPPEPALASLVAEPLASAAKMTFCPVT
jgi:hypothetical protein